MKLSMKSQPEPGKSIRSLPGDGDGDINSLVGRLGGQGYALYNPPLAGRTCSFPESSGQDVRKWPDLPQYRQHLSRIRRSLSLVDSQVHAICMGSGSLKGRDKELHGCGLWKQS